jgi:flagellar hook-length control protein FliK
MPLLNAGQCACGAAESQNDPSANSNSTAPDPDSDASASAQHGGNTWPALKASPPRIDLLPESGAGHAGSGQAAGTSPLPGANAAVAPALLTTSSVQARAPTTGGSQTTVPIAGLTVEIVSQFNAGSNRFDFRLDPPELGRINVRLDVDRDGKVTSRLVADRPETLDILRRNAPELERSLQQSGLKTADNGLQFSLRDQGGFNAFTGQNPYPQNGSPTGTTRMVAPDRDLPPVDGGHPSGAATGIDIRV